MKRSAPLRRKTRLRARRATQRRSARVRDPAYMAWIRRQPCAANFLSPCYGPIEADHTGGRGMSQKSDDTTCIPLCQRHHQLRTDFHGPFKDWDQEKMRRWLRAERQWFNHEYAIIGRKRT